MQRDIRKLGDYLLDVTSDGLALERKIEAWERRDQAEAEAAFQQNASVQNPSDHSLLV